VRLVLVQSYFRMLTSYEQVHSPQGTQPLARATGRTSADKARSVRKPESIPTTLHVPRSASKSNGAYILRLEVENGVCLVRNSHVRSPPSNHIQPNPTIQPHPTKSDRNKEEKSDQRKEEEKSAHIRPIKTCTMSPQHAQHDQGSCVRGCGAQCACSPRVIRP
jgi:hypothetical protein